MSEEKTFFDFLFEESEEEKEIQKKLDEERTRYETTDAFKEHEARLGELLDELKKAGKERREEARKYFRSRRKGKTFSFKTDEEIAEIRRKNQEAYEKEIEALPDDLKAVIRGYEALEEPAKEVFKKKTWAYHSDYDKYKNPKTTEKDLSELLQILVQTTIDFINERDLAEIDAIGFSVDGLRDSLEWGEWEPSTDASISAYGLGTEKGEDGKEYGVVQKIGEYM